MMQECLQGDNDKDARARAHSQCPYFPLLKPYISD